MKHEPMDSAKPFAGKETVEEEIKEHGPGVAGKMAAAAPSLSSLRAALSRINA